MSKIALIETKRSRTNYKELFGEAFEFDRFALCSDVSIKKVLKVNVDIEFNPDDYEWIILVGAEAYKYYTKGTSLSDYSGKVVNDKFIPIINPAMLTFKPEAKRLWEDSKTSLIGYVTGGLQKASYDTDNFIGITDEAEAIAYVKDALACSNSFIALDSETTAFYPRDGYVLGISLCYKKDHGAYISADCITEEVSGLLQELFYKKTVVFHNAKFDKGFLSYHFGWVFPNVEDTMLIHYCIDENPGGHGLKQLALKYTKYGDYEAPLEEFITNYRKTHGILKSQFTYDLIPFEIIKTYAAIDAVVTFLLYIKFKPVIIANKKLLWVYDNLLIPGSNFLEKVQDTGVPFDIDRLHKARQMMQMDIDGSVATMYENPIIREFEAAQGKEFNPGSVMQLRKLLFDFLGLSPTGKKTGTGKNSTDAEVLMELSQEHPIPKLILDIRKKSKIKNTYLDKIIPQLNRDGRLRTGFNLHSTTSGRLSSSGKLNMQQLPRDNPAVKGCIKARPGYKIVSMDLKTAEVYIAAVLANDKALMRVFQTGGDFHSTVAKMVFHLDCPVEEVAKKYPLLRQAAKAITFGIMYQASADKIASEIQKSSGEYCSRDQAQQYIDDYFNTFNGLKKWIEANKKNIKDNGFCYSFFGRKRRLPNVKSTDKAIVGHTVRSGINFLVQSPASDVNLLGAIDMMKFIETSGSGALMFALVHDSILAEVPENEVEQYCIDLKRFVQLDRGISIPGFPIGCDFDIGDDYAFKDKYLAYEEEWDKQYADVESDEADDS